MTRSVAIQGSAAATVIITGDHNRVQLAHDTGFAFRLLDDNFREAQRRARPADFYNGTRPNWANIARGDDARRTLLDRLLDFLLDPQGHWPAQRIGVLTGLSGEGKTTLLMRALWEAAERGLPVLWRHYGTVEQPYERPFAGVGTVILGLDDLPFVENLERLVSDLSEHGLSFALVGSARTHEWANSDLSTTLRRTARVELFEVGRLQLPEVDDLLARLEGHGALGALAQQSAAQRRAYFLDRLQADGQLLPALLTARRGKSFEAILDDVFDKLVARYGEERAHLLLRGYAGIALVHRFGFWMSRRLLAAFSGIEERRLTPDLLHPLEGELTEITAADARRLYTRHPWIADQALRQLCGRRLEEEHYLYEDLFDALGRLLQTDPKVREERKLTTMLPLAFKYQGDVARARELFARAAQADPHDAPTLQAWALLEKEQGDVARARELFARAAQADPKHAPVFQAWALMEAQQGHREEALRILEKGLRQVHRRRERAILLSTRGGTLARMQRWDEAEEAFRQALRLHARNPLTHYHFAVDLLLKRGRTEEACAHLRRAQALRPRKPRDRRKIEQALARHCTKEP